MKYTRTTYVEFHFHAGQLEELHTKSEKVATRDIEGLEIPEIAFGFRFYDILTATVVDYATVDAGVEVRLSSEPINCSVTYYNGGTIISEDEIRQLPGIDDFLEEMKKEGCTRAIKVRKDIYLPFRDDDVCLDPDV